MGRRILIFGLVLLLIVGLGCISEEPTSGTITNKTIIASTPEPPQIAQPPIITPPPATQEEEIELLVTDLGYDDGVAQSVAREVNSWTDKQGNLLIDGWKGELNNTKERYEKGKITIDEVTAVEVKITRELSQKIKEEIPDYLEDNWHLENVTRDKGANCAGYTQLLFILGRTIGLSVEPIEVLELRDIKKGHVAVLINLSNARKVLVDLAYSPIFISEMFLLEKGYGKVGNYLEVLDKNNPIVPYTRIRTLDEDGLIAIMHINRGEAYDSSGEYSKAISENDKAIELDPKYSIAYNNRGMAYYSLGDYSRAISDLDRAIELNPKFAVAYSNRGVVYGSLGDYSRAISDLDRAIGLNPKLAEAYNNRGNAYDYLGDYSRAISDLDRAIELNPKYAKAYNNRGNAYDDLGDYSRAISDYDKAIELDPKSAVAYFYRGGTYYYLGDYSRAISDFDKAIELDPKLAEAYVSRGYVYYN